MKPQKPGQKSPAPAMWKTWHSRKTLSQPCPASCRSGTGKSGL